MESITSVADVEMVSMMKKMKNWDVMRLKLLKEFCYLELGNMTWEYGYMLGKYDNRH